MEGKRAIETKLNIGTVDYVCLILNLLVDAGREGIDIEYISDKTRLLRQTVSRYLKTMEQFGYVECDPVTGTFHLGRATQVAASGMTSLLNGKRGEK